MANKINIGIIGGAGYTGGELLRILVNHPAAEIVFVNSKTHAGKAVHFVHPDLTGETDIQFTGELHPLMDGGVDLLFLCVGHGEAEKFLSSTSIDEKIKIIDLSQNFRLKEQSVSGKRSFIYGLPELNREKIRTANNIANPGCFATSIQLGLLPLAGAGLLGEVYTTGITGSTGAGQSLTATSQFSWRANNIQAYKTLTHQHLNEIYQSLHQLQNNFPASPSGTSRSFLEGDGGRTGDINFVPWRGDFTRGIFISSQLKCDLGLDKLNELYKAYYNNHPFVTITKERVFLKQVVNTNKCIIQLEKQENNLVVHAVIDNLLKGASGQAVQNMNLMFGLGETAGLKLKATGF